MRHNIIQTLEAASDKKLAEKIIHSFIEVERNYFLKSWKTSELDAGHFVENVRRFIELKLAGHYTPFNSSLPKFNNTTLTGYENLAGHESYRILIPRVLYSVYCIRNKRGVGHSGEISPNHTDATYILASVKWVLAELIRLNSNYSPDETTKMLDHLNDRNIEGIWENGDVTRILADGLKLQEQIIFLLNSSSIKTAQGLMEAIEPKTEKYFRKKLQELHDKRFVDKKTDGTIIITPKGSKFAEEIILTKVNV